MTAHIYTITHVPSKRVYVGSSTSPKFHLRKNHHLWRLRHQQHWCPELQATFNRDSESTLKFQSIEPVANPLHLHAVEQTFLDYYRSLPAGIFNVLTTATPKGRVMPAAARAKMSASKTGVKRSAAAMAGFDAVREKRKRPIERLNPWTGERKEYAFIASVVEDGFSRQNVNNVLQGRQKTAGDCLWRYLDDSAAPWVYDGTPVAQRD
jgi:hypothetical protein